MLCGISSVFGTTSSLHEVPSSKELLSSDDLVSNNLATWWSYDDPEPQQLMSNSIIEGDSIRIQAQFEEDDENPESQIDTISWVASKGFVVNRTGTLLIPEEEYEPFIMGVEVEQFRWEYIEDIQLNDFVQVNLVHSNTDTDVLVYWNGTNTDGWSAATSILGLVMATANLNGESGSFVADRSGVLAVGIYCYDKQPGEYYLTVNTRESESGIAQGNAVRYDTWRWGQNVTIDIEFVGTAANGMISKLSYTNVTFQNFFRPVVANVNVVSQGDIKHITWDIVDRNRYESHSYEVLISLDAGLSFQLVAAGLQSPFYAWNIAGYGRFENCQIQIRAYDDIGLRGVGFSPIFVVSSSDGASNERWFTISSTGNLTYVWGSTGNDISWEICSVDSMPLFYEVSIDNRIVSTGWSSGESIDLNVDGLEIGAHEAKLSIDTGSYTFNETLVIVVIPDSSQYIRQALITFSAIMILISGITAAEIKRRI